MYTPQVLFFFPSFKNNVWAVGFCGTIHFNHRISDLVSTYLQSTIMHARYCGTCWDICYYAPMVHDLLREEIFGQKLGDMCKNRSISNRYVLLCPFVKELFSLLRNNCLNQEN